MTQKPVKKLTGSLALPMVSTAIFLALKNSLTDESRLVMDSVAKGISAAIRFLRFLLVTGLKFAKLIWAGQKQIVSSRQFFQYSTTFFGLGIALLAFYATQQQAETNDRMLILSRYDKLVEVDTETRNRFKVSEDALSEATKAFQEIALDSDPVARRQKIAPVRVDTRDDLRTLLGCTPFGADHQSAFNFNIDSDRKRLINFASANLKAAISVNPKLFASSYQLSAASILACHGTATPPSYFLFVERDELEMDGNLPRALHAGNYTDGWFSWVKSYYTQFEFSSSFDGGSLLAASQRLRGSTDELLYRNALLLTGADLLLGQEARLDAVLSQYKDPEVQLYAMTWINAGVCASRYTQSCTLTRNRLLQIVCNNLTGTNRVIEQFGLDSGTSKVLRFYSAFSALEACNNLWVAREQNTHQKFIFSAEKSVPFSN